MRELNELCALIVDCEHKTAPKSPYGYPSIRTPNVGRGRLILEGANRVDRDTYAKWTRRAVPQTNDLIVAREAPVGNVAIVQEDQLVCLGQRTVLVRPDPDKVDPAFLCYFMLGDYVQAQFQGVAIGATVPHLNMADIRGLAIPELPPLPTQRRIASILSAYDDLIENNTRRIAILEEMARRLYEEWFVHFRFPGHEEQDHAGGGPSGWGRQQLSELVMTQYGYTASASVDPVGPKLLRGMDINKQSYIDWAQVPYCLIETKKMEKYRLEEGDLLVIRMADPGKIGFVEESVDAVFASYLVRLKIVSPDITPLYLFFVLNGDSYQGYITGVSTGTTRKSASAGVITGYEVDVPPRALLERFQTLISPFRRQMKTLVRKNTNLRSQRDLLLPKLVSGEIDVSSSEEQVKAAVA